MWDIAIILNSWCFVWGGNPIPLQADFIATEYCGDCSSNLSIWVLCLFQQSTIIGPLNFEHQQISIVTSTNTHFALDASVTICVDGPSTSVWCYPPFHCGILSGPRTFCAECLVVPECMNCLPLPTVYICGSKCVCVFCEQHSWSNLHCSQRMACLGDPNSNTHIL